MAQRRKRRTTETNNEHRCPNLLHERSMKHCHENHKNRMKNGSLLVFGIVNLLWLVFRTGTKPTRIVYPCQRTALSNVSLFLCVSVPLFATSFFGKTEKLLSRRAKVLALLFLLGSAAVNIGQVLTSSGQTASPGADQEFRLTLQAENATTFPASDIYVVSGHIPNPVSELTNLMGSHGLLFYKSSTEGKNSGAAGLVARDDVVLIKINEQWSERGGTNTDILKELIQAIVNHPDGFIGEIVVADNGQGYGSMNWTRSNAENITQSTQAVVDMFSPYCNVSTYDWQPIRGINVDEYSSGDNRTGYICYSTADPQTGIYVSYPKFQTKYGTRISFKHGVWNGTDYEQRLKVISVPVLKTHWTYGVTGCVKHYMGVQSEGQAVYGGLANGHSTVAKGGMGTLMVETRLPSLNILDATYVNANPMQGPATSYSSATRVNVLIVSTDPVVLDYWAAKHVLMQTAHLIGRDDTSTMDPDSTGTGLFHLYLNQTKNVISAGGYNVTTDENRMNVYILQTPDTVPPVIFVLSPKNATFPAKNVSLSFEVNEPTAWVGYCLDGGENVTISQNTTIATLADGRHQVVVYANDTSGNTGASKTVYFSIDTTPPNITDLSQTPRGDQVLSTDEVSVSATVRDNLSGVKQVTLNYTCGNETWFQVSMTNLEGNVWRATIPAFPYLTNVTYIVVAQDWMNNTIATQDTRVQYQVVPEIPSVLVLQLFLSSTLLAVAIRKKRHRATAH